MCLEFPDDPTSWFLDRQFMVGESLIVAPVFTENGEVQFYLPEGLWTSFWDDNETVRGPTWRKEKHGYNTMPIYVRQGTVLVLGEGEGIDSEGFEYDWLSKGGTVKLYHVKQHDEAILVDAKGDIATHLIVDGEGKVDNPWSLSGQWKVTTISTQQTQGSN
jgi:alpha-D-xyloside xylohydrolase